MMERGITKILTFAMRQSASKSFGKIILKPGLESLEKTQVTLGK